VKNKAYRKLGLCSEDNKLYHDIKRKSGRLKTSRNPVKPIVHGNSQHNIFQNPFIGFKRPGLGVEERLARAELSDRGLKSNKGVESSGMFICFFSRKKNLSMLNWIPIQQDFFQFDKFYNILLIW
jgi:hypothetical protein